MKPLVSLCLALSIGCGQSADVISKDGTQDLGVCWDANWVSCISKACPNGFDVIRSPDPNKNDGMGLVKCK